MLIYVIIVLIFRKKYDKDEFFNTTIFNQSKKTIIARSTYRTSTNKT